MQVSFIIPLYNCFSLTRECVTSLQRSLPAGLQYEIILVDDGSSDETRKWLSTLPPPFRVILNELNLGYAKSNNRGAKLAQGDLLCLLNNDLIFAPGWWQPLHALQRKLGLKAGAIGNVQRRVSDRSIDHSGIRINHKCKPEHSREWFIWPRRSRQVPAVTGACLLIDRLTFLQDGGFDENFLNGGEDVDLCFQMTRRGLINSVALRSGILHHVSASPGRKQRDEANSYYLAKKWQSQLTALAIRPWIWEYLARHWSDNIESVRWREAISCLFYGLHLSPRPPQSAIEGIKSTMENEMKRWQTLFPDSSSQNLDS